MHDSSSRPLRIEGKQLSVHADFAVIQLVPVEAGEAPWVEVFARDPERVPVHVEDDGAVVHVSVGGAEGAFGGPHWDGHPLRVVLHLPRQVRVRAHTSAGKLFARDLAGEIELRSDAGTIDVESLHGTLKLSTSAGKIDGTNVGGSLDVESNAGAVRLEVSHLDPGRHHVRTTVGATRLELARGMPVRVEARTTMGSARVSFPSSRDAAAILEVEADLGAVKVRESSRVWVAPRADDTAAPVPAGPFRTQDVVAEQAPMSDEDLEAVLAKVARGELSPGAARELLRAMGHA